MDITIFDTTLADTSDLAKQAKVALRYVIENRRSAELSAADKLTLGSLPDYSKTIMSTIARRLIDNDFFDLCLLLDFKQDDALANFPEILTLRDFNLDGSEIEGSVPDDYKKVILNLTPILGKRRDPTAPITVADKARFDHMLVRGALCRSYANSDAWLSGSLAIFMVESYSMAMAATLTQHFSLPYTDFARIRIMFAIYMAQMLNQGVRNIECPPILQGCRELVKDNVLTDVIEEIAGDRSESFVMTFDKIVELIRKHGPHRMSKLTLGDMFRFTAMGSVEPKALMMAMEYPPYWAYFVLSGLSNVKHSLMITLFKKMRYAGKAQDFGEKLAKSIDFFQGVK